MKFFINFIFLCLLTLSSLSFAGRLSREAKLICSQLKSKPNFKYDAYFSEKFRKKIPYSQITEIFSQIFEAYGKCQSYQIKNTTPQSGKIFILTDKNYRLRFSISTEIQENTQSIISGLMFRGASQTGNEYESYTEISKDLDKLSGSPALVIRNLSKKSSLFEYRGDSKQALGSEFKLYVLWTLINEIMKGNQDWDKKIPIKEAWKSLPSGILQDELPGKQYSLYELAKLMIQISDNTATDHLMHLLGRKNIESYLKPNINSFIKDNLPFLTTYELFLLKLHLAKKINMFESLNYGEKLAFLQNNRIPIKELSEITDPWLKPRDIESIEWFGSKNDICNVFDKMLTLPKEHKEKVLTILEHDLGDEELSKHYSYVGYKGGSEPGVYERSFLLQLKKSSEWLCLSSGINSSQENINHQDIENIIQPALELLAQKCEISQTQYKTVLNLPYKDFDQTIGKGWRQFSDDGCEFLAIKLLKSYTSKHKAQLKDWQLRILNFHTGQLLAFKNKYEEAIGFWKNSFDIEEKKDPIVRWNAYVRASIAFLEKNMKGLLAARIEIAKGKKLNGSIPNLDIIDSFMKNFRDSYRKAYRR